MVRHVRKTRRPRKTRRARKGRGNKVSVPIRKAITKAVRKEIQDDVEMKYVTSAVLKYSGQTTNSDGSFWSDNTGLIKTCDASYV